MMSREDEDSLLDGLEHDEIEELADKVESELQNRDRERIDASLGMFSLSVESHESLEETVDAFEQVWERRILELESAKADMVREKLEDDDMGFILG